MSISLRTSASTTVELKKVKTLNNGVVLQHVGTNFQDTTQLAMTLNVGKTGTARGRCNIKVPYSADKDRGLPAGFIFATIEFSVAEQAPISVASALSYLAGSLCETQEFKDMVLQRSVNVA